MYRLATSAIFWNGGRERIHVPAAPGGAEFILGGCLNPRPSCRKEGRLPASSPPQITGDTDAVFQGAPGMGGWGFQVDLVYGTAAATSPTPPWFPKTRNPLSRRRNYGPHRAGHYVPPRLRLGGTHRFVCGISDRSSHLFACPRTFARRVPITSASHESDVPAPHQ